MTQLFRSAVGLMLLWCSSIYAEVRIVITQGVDSSRPIAIIPFKQNTSNISHEEISSIIGADLRNSGKFNPISFDRMPQHPTVPSEVKPIVWSALGIDAVVVGQIQKNDDGSYFISYQLVDTLNNPGVVLAENKYKVTEKWLRYAAHTISDELFQKITGIKGAFRTRIAYVVQTKNSYYPYELRVSDYDGYNQFIVHRARKPLMSPAWSPDGNKLAYVTFESGKSTLVVQTLSNGSINQIADFPRHNGAPAFSPDGSKLAFVLSKTGSLNIYVMDLNSGKIRQITNNRSNNTEPSWFPNSTDIAFTSDQGGTPQIYKLSINNSLVPPQRLSWDSSQNQNSEVSADGKFLVMVSVINGEQHITKLDFNNNHLQVLTDTFLDQTPSLSPNGTMVIYNSLQGSNAVLRLVSTDGRFKAKLPATDGQIKFPAWSPYL